MNKKYIIEITFRDYASIWVSPGWNGSTLLCSLHTQLATCIDWTDPPHSPFMVREVLDPRQSFLHIECILPPGYCWMCSTSWNPSLPPGTCLLLLHWFLHIECSTSWDSFLLIPRSSTPALFLATIYSFGPSCSYLIPVSCLLVLLALLAALQ